MPGYGSIHFADYIVVLAYFAILVFAGMYFSKFVKQAKDYFAAGASVPWWLAGISLWMASFSALMFVVYSQLAYKYGFVSVMLTWVTVPAMILAAVYFSARWRRARVMTPLGFMEQRYNKVVHQLFVWTGIPLRFIDNSIKIYSTAIFMVVAVGQSWFTIEMCIAMVGIIMILYTLLGGQFAVIVTDFIQFAILCLSVLVLFPLSLIAVGGVNGLVTKAPEGFFNLFNPPYGPFDWVMFCLLILISYNATWSYVQKYNCVEKEKDARLVAVTMCVLFIIGPVIFFVPAMAGRILMPELMANNDQTKYTYILVCLKLLPVGMMGLMVSAIFSATMSTLGSEYNVLSGVLTKDFYGRVIKPNASEDELVKWGRINTAIIGFITILFALGIDYIKGFNLYDIMNKAIGALGPAIMLPLLGGLAFRKINSRGAITGVVFGTLSGIGLVLLNIVLIAAYKERIEIDPSFSYWMKQGWNSMSIGVNIIVTILGMWLGSIIGKTPEDEVKRASEFLGRMDVISDSQCVKVEDGRKSPFYAVGISLMFLGSIVIVIGIVMNQLGTPKALLIDLIAGGILFVSGIAMFIKTSIDWKRREA